MAGIKIVDLPAVGRDLAATDLFEMSLAGGTGSRKITGQEIMNASKLSVNNTPVINGTSGRIFFQGSTNVLQQSGNLFWDDVNGRLGVGTSNPQARYNQSQTQGILARYDVTNANADQNRGVWEFYTNTAATPDFFGRFGFKFEGGINNAARQFQLHVGDNTTPRFVVNGSGNVLINTTTDAGFRLDVNGTARVAGLGTFGSGIRVIGQGIFGANGTNNAGVVGIDQSGTSSAARIYMCNGAGSAYPIWFDAGGTSYFNAGNVGIGTTSPSTLLHVAGNITIGGASATTVSSTYNSTTRNQIRYTNGASLEFHEGANERVRLAAGTGNVLINTTTDSGYLLDVNGTARVQGNFSVGTTQSTWSIGKTIEVGAIGSFLFGGSSTQLILGTNSYFNSGWKYAINGAVAQYEQSSGNHVWHSAVSGTANNTATVNRLATLWNNGNFGIGTGATDAGFKLDVNGTARVQGVFSALNASSDGIRLRNDTGAYPAIEFWQGVLRASITRETNSGLSFSAGGYAMHTSGGGTLVGGTSRFDLNASAQLQADSTTKGFLPPRMTQTQRNAIASPAIGLEIYQTDATEGKYIYKSSGWTYIG
jgi:hypothetical protein